MRLKYVVYVSACCMLHNVCHAMRTPRCCPEETPKKQFGDSNFPKETDKLFSRNGVEDVKKLTLMDSS